MGRHTRILSLALAGAALAEFLLLRFILRMGPELPTGGAVEDAVSLAYRAGVWSLNFAGMLAVAVLGMTVFESLREQRLRALVAAMVIVASGTLILAVWAGAVSGGSEAMLLAQTTGVPAAMLCVFLAVRRQGWRGALLLLVLAAYASAGLHFATRTAGAGNATAWLLTIAETAAVLSALLVPFALSAGTVSPVHRRLAVAAATGAALFYMAFAFFEPTIAGFFVMWGSGFASSVPWPVQAVALWAIVYAVVSGLPGTAAIGFLLVALAGIRLEYTYFSLLALAGFTLLALSKTETLPRVEQQLRERPALSAANR
jgi:hypothetical protein